MTVNPSSAIPPSLDKTHIYVYSDDIFPIEKHIIRDIGFERSIRAMIVLDEASVQINRTVAAHAVKEERDSFVSVFVTNVEMLSVPCIMIVEKSGS